MLNDTCDEELLKAAGSELKVVSSYSAGCEIPEATTIAVLTLSKDDHIALDALKTRKVRLGYTPSALTDSVADLTVMLVIMAQRRAGEVR